MKPEPHELPSTTVDNAVQANTTPPERKSLLARHIVNQLIKGQYDDVFSVLGMHPYADGRRQVTVFLPGAQAVSVVTPGTHKLLGELSQVHEEGLFSGLIDRQRQCAYKLCVCYPKAELWLDDPYRFPSLLDPTDLYLFNDGTQEQAWRFLGANHRVVDDVEGVLFAVWAPNARRVALVCDTNHWDGRLHLMRRHPASGVWDIFMPGIAPGTAYKYAIVGADGHYLPLKADPYAQCMQLRPGNASLVPARGSYAWHDDAWLQQRHAAEPHLQPVSIYEVHLGSWRRRGEQGEQFIDYRTLASELLPYVQDLGFTHLQLMPVSEYPFDDSWGYQPLGLFAPSARFGTPDDLRYFIDEAHQRGLAVLLDWVPGHFPSDAHGLALFDGSHLYEHADPRMGHHPDWNTCIFNYGRAEVQSYLLSNALYWLEAFHVDGLRVDAVASMLYLDYSRKDGEWIPNRLGGRENIEAIELLRAINKRAYFNYPGVMMVAEESTAWPGVTHHTERAGLGFGFKWNMGWMNDTLRYLSRDPVYRRFHHNEMTFSLLYSFSEHFVLPLSHDEVVHGKRSLLERVPGDDWQKFATLRAYYAFMWTHPGKKLLFMGGEFAQRREWNCSRGLDWSCLSYASHLGVQAVVRDLNMLYRNYPACYELDHSAEGFEWVDADNYLHSLFIYRRRGRVASEQLLVVLNFTPTPHVHLRIGVAETGFHTELFNSDARHYGGSGMGNCGGLEAEPVPAHGKPWSLSVAVPPLAVVIFTPGRGEEDSDGP